jgi:hypothetical protein
LPGFSGNKRARLEGLEPPARWVPGLPDLESLTNAHGRDTLNP